MASFLPDYERFRGNGEANEQGLSLDEFLKNYDPYRYKTPSVTTDCAVFSYEKEPFLSSTWRVLLIQRRNHPCIGYWALPGGFLEIYEDMIEGARRELEEETGIQGLVLEQLCAYGEYDRDPRTRIVTGVYFTAVEASQVKAQAADDAKDACWFTLSLEDETVSEGILHHLTLSNEERDLRIRCTVLETVTPGLIRERHMKVLDPGILSSDHGAIITQCWETLRSRL